MSLNEIKQAVLSGKTVYWCNGLYEVIRDRFDRWLIVCNANGSAIGLTWRDGETLNGCPGEFYVVK